MKIYQIRLLKRNITLQHDNQTTLLSCLEKHGINLEYQCRAGYCGSCRITIKKGKVSYVKKPLAFIQPNEVLLCCCHVEEDLEIEL